MSDTTKTGIYPATSSDVNGVTGQYFARKKARPLGFEQGYGRQLWDATEALLERALTSPTTPN